eukprot:gnl/MRDRNA2_/MRDRNA2_489285_c0_seq1.p1 gnl/MRDRNA2_/MRDRNA2_489285_c0~~gnl/MRDRNA2_/MRDRNA2_489285_c0_seq1.p1  ORF type:complete len:152 (-),score=12.65 gnl/MRDRNA2_/MRDRNA2_489285_c0_seq1:88-543(-)
MTIIAGDSGAGITHFGAMTLVISPIFNNKASDSGGAISNKGSMSLTRCPIPGNVAVNRENPLVTGEPLWNCDGGNVTFVNSPIFNDGACSYPGTFTCSQRDNAATTTFKDGSEQYNNTEIPREPWPGMRSLQTQEILSISRRASLVSDILV